MHALVVISASGDDRHEFDPADAPSVEGAQAKFDQLLDAGYTAAARTGEGQSVKVTKFNPDVQETLFIPRLRGG